MAVIQVQQATSYKETIPFRRRAIKAKQGMVTTVEFQLLNSAGLPLDLSDESYDHVSARVREAVCMTGTGNDITATIVTDKTTGNVSFDVPTTVLQYPGVYLVDVGVINADGFLLESNDFYLYVENSAWGQPSNMPQLDDIRLSLRDSDPAENELINNWDFDLAEICHAAVRSVLDWNETPPDLANARFNTLSFPFKHIWLYGIHTYLFFVAEEHYRRNHLPYSAGGVNIDDKNRHQLYGQAAMMRQKDWNHMLLRQKVSMNMNRGFRTISSGYPF